MCHDTKFSSETWFWKVIYLCQIYVNIALPILNCIVQWHLVHLLCCTNSTLSSSQIFPSSKIKLLTHEAFSPDLWQSTNLHSVFIDLSILGISCKWNHAWNMTFNALICTLGNTNSRINPSMPHWGLYSKGFLFFPFHCCFYPTTIPYIPLTSEPDSILTSEFLMSTGFCKCYMLLLVCLDRLSGFNILSFWNFQRVVFYHIAIPSFI